MLYVYKLLLMFKCPLKKKVRPVIFFDLIKNFKL